MLGAPQATRFLSAHHEVSSAVGISIADVLYSFAALAWAETPISCGPCASRPGTNCFATIFTLLLWSAVHERSRVS